MMGLLGRIKSLTISSAVWIQYTNVTGRRTDTGRQQRPRLRIASRGKRKSDCGEMVHAWTVDHWSLVAYNWRVSGRGIEVSFSERSVLLMTVGGPAIRLLRAQCKWSPVALLMSLCSVDCHQPRVTFSRNSRRSWAVTIIRFLYQSIRYDTVGDFNKCVCKYSASGNKMKMSVLVPSQKLVMFIVAIYYIYLYTPSA